jgi:NarL family two-component system response regulator YdfI
MTTRILIIDHHEVLRAGLRSLLARLRATWEICGEGVDGEQAIRLTQELQPHLVILDITMPRMSRLEASSRIRNSGPRVPILIFTNPPIGKIIHRSPAGGCSGVCPKIASRSRSGCRNAPQPKRTISAPGRKRITAAQKARWAKVRSAG